MGEERRKQAALGLYQDDAGKDSQRAADGFIARTKNFRPQFVKRLPIEKRAQYLASLPLPVDVAAQLIVAYHFTFQRGLMTDFLDALGIANDQGMIADDAEISRPDDAKLASAVETLQAKHAAEDVEIYLETLLVQNPDVWGGLEKLLKA